VKKEKKKRLFQGGEGQEEQQQKVREEENRDGKTTGRLPQNKNPNRHSSTLKRTTGTVRGCEGGGVGGGRVYCQGRSAKYSAE